MPLELGAGGGGEGCGSCGFAGKLRSGQSAVHGHKTVPVGVDNFGESGSIDEEQPLPIGAHYGTYVIPVERSHCGL